MKKSNKYILFGLACAVIFSCQTEGQKKAEPVQEKPINPFIKLPVSFCSNDSPKSFTLTLDSFNNFKFTGNWFRLAGHTENGQDAREDEDIKSISYDTANSTLSFTSPVSDDTNKIIFKCIMKNNGRAILVSKNFEFADTLSECN